MKTTTSSATASRRSSTALHDLLRTIEEWYGLPHAGAAAGVTPIAGIFTSDRRSTSVTFRNGVAGYTGTHTTYIEQPALNAAHATATQIVTDGSPLSHGLIRFDAIFGEGPGQVPARAQILSAKLVLLTGSTSGDNSGTSVSVHRMLVGFTDSSTWNTLAGGINLGSDAAATPDFTALANTVDTWTIFDVTQTVTSWVATPSTNRGWAVMPGGTDGWRWASVAAPVNNRPMLEVTYTLPPCGPVDLVGPGGDAGHDGVLTVDDLVAFLAAFFSASPDADVTSPGGGASPDGQVTVDDLVTALQLFFAGCP
ncbi:MAG: GC-type dockerin domain-anchored protein [Phycisphaerales bacterium]